MDYRTINQQSLEKLLKNGAAKAVSVLTVSETHELTFEGFELSMMRTSFNNSLELEYYKDDKKGRATINQLSDIEIDAAVAQAIELCASSKADATNDIAPFQPPEQFTSGAIEPDMPGMSNRLIEFTETLKREYPTVVLRSAALKFVKYATYYQNSNSVDFVATENIYEFNCVFLAKEGLKTSSFNYTGFLTADMQKGLIEQGTVRNLLNQIIEQTTTKKLNGAFSGDVIFSPDCFFGFMFNCILPLRDGSLMTGSSIYKNKLNQQIANEKFNLNFEVSGKTLPERSFLTRDGFKAADLTVIENGVLKSFILSHKGALKTGLTRAANYGRGMVVGAGDSSFEAMVNKIQKGLLVCRYSGSSPSENGDFSGVAKNSYYIENGEIKYPVSEVMISGNTADLLMNIQEISQERVNFGHSMLPYVSVNGITISGK